jgi:hypothetical protein
MPDLAIIIVSWNVRNLLRRCLLSLLRQQTLVLERSEGTDNRHITHHASRFTSEIWVIDNASADGSVEMVRAEFPRVNLIANAGNVGFGAANNQGIAASQSRYVLILNPDTEIVSDALTTMVAYLDGHPDVGVVGPQLRYPDGSIQSSRRRFPTLATALLESTILQQWWPRNRVLSHYYVLEAGDDETREVDWVTGACFMVRRAAIEQVGMFDPRFFMYSEELDWCKRIKDAGWKVVYLPTAQVIHHEGKSSEQIIPARHIRFHTSKVLYFKKHRGWFAGELVRWFLLGMFGYQLLEEGLKWLVGHKRPLRRERVAAYWQVVKSRLGG